MNTRVSFITGGVVSSLGKGTTAAALGRLLVGRGLRISLMKLDPYLNVDPGTMSPYEHGEVYVTQDGAETDLDLGHYERFAGFSTHRAANVTTGQIYNAVVRRERQGGYLGRTVQVVPHITDEIQRRIRVHAEAENADVLIVEVGGTVGDIESLPFLEAIRQFRTSQPAGHVLFVHVTLVPYLGAAGELKTKPTQHSVQELRKVGIQPDLLVLRSDSPVPTDIRHKIAGFASLPATHVLSAHNVRSLYEVPLVLAEQNADTLALDHLRLVAEPRNLRAWADMVDLVNAADQAVTIGLVGKYVQLEDAYMSVIEALRHACIRHRRQLNISWIDSERDGDHLIEQVRACDAIVVPGGFGSRGVEGKVTAIHAARQHRIPFLGICLGMQAAVIQHARQHANMPDADSTEFRPDTAWPVIDLLPEQRDLMDVGGSMRLGSHPARIKPGTLAHRLYGETVCYERHRHRFEVNPKHRRALEDSGLIVSGFAPDDRLVEIIELPACEHPFFIACQAHPEFTSRPLDPHPLFQGLIDAAVSR